MSEQTEDFAPKPPSHLLRNVGLALAAIYVVASLYLIVELRGRVAGLEKGQQANALAIKDQSGLIAHTRDDLEYLKHRGDRNYYEFTLKKGAHPTPVSTVSLQLKKADQKKSRFTLNVIADDRTIEKKDRSISEPLQFITGRDRTLYELVVMSVDKDKVS